MLVNRKLAQGCNPIGRTMLECNTCTGCHVTGTTNCHTSSTLHSREMPPVSFIAPRPQSRAAKHFSNFSKVHFVPLIILIATVLSCNFYGCIMVTIVSITMMISERPKVINTFKSKSFLKIILHPLTNSENTVNSNSGIVNNSPKIWNQFGRINNWYEPIFRIEK